MSFFTIEFLNDRWSLGAEVGEVPTMAAIEAAGEYPWGDFWGSVVEYLFQTDPQLAGKRDTVEIDPDTQGLYVYGTDEQTVIRVQELLEPLATDPDEMAGFITNVTATGFIFD